MSTWVPQQHGAWAMLIVPWVVGVAVGGVAWRQLLLLVAWLLGYLAYAALGQWLRVPASRRARWQPPLLTFGAATILTGGPLVLLRPDLLRWAPWFAVLLGISLWCSARRADRSWLNDVVTQVAACTMTLVAAGIGSGSATTGTGWLPPGAGDPRARLAALIVFAYFLGTVFYVKTMIRRRGHTGTYVASVGYHAVVAVGGWLLGPLPGVVGTLLMARAALVPRRWPTAAPAQIGIGEILASVAVAVAALTAV